MILINTKRKAVSKEVKGCKELKHEVQYLLDDEYDIKKIAIDQRGYLVWISFSSGHRKIACSLNEVYKVHIY